MSPLAVTPKHDRSHVSDFLDVKRREITERLNELRPMVDEYQRLEAAAAALATVSGNGTRKAAATATAAAPAPAAAAKAPARAKRTRTRRAAGAAARRPGRRRGSGTRAAQALSLVQGNPGIAIPELADKMGIKQNYLYRVLPGLEQDGKVKREGRGWHATSKA
jgi:hypothetical protein